LKFLEDKRKNKKNKEKAKYSKVIKKIKKDIMRSICLKSKIFKDVEVGRFKVSK